MVVLFFLIVLSNTCYLYYNLVSYNYVANNPIKYIDPDGREFIGEFDTYRTSIEEEGLTSGEVPGCPECDPIGMLREVLITATRLIGPQTLEEQLAYLEETKEIRAENQNTMYPLPQATGSLDVANDELNFVPFEKLFAAGAKLLGLVPFITKGVKWGAPVGKVTYGVGEGVYDLGTTLGKYVGQSKNIMGRVTSHFAKGGKLSAGELQNAVFHSMPGSTKLQREVYEQFLITKYGGPKGGQILNVVNPMGGRMDQYNSMIEGVIKQFNLPR